MADDARLLQWRNLPMELRLKKQWLVANPANKNPLFRRDNQFYNASVSKHLNSQWMSFEEATTTALTYNLAIGFVICEGEEITCIDLDVKPHTTKETLNLYDSIVHSFDSYAERSISGQGIHIWCKGSIGLGRKRDGVEIYSQNRFMICTGNVLHNKEQLEFRQPMLTNMVSQMPMSADYAEIVLEELPQIETDEVIGAKLFEIEDAQMLWKGQWQDLGHPSQSEGDLDLMVYLVRYSPSNEQCRRLFRQSGLGKRTKANRLDYINRTLRHSRYIRQNELVDAEVGRRSAEAIAAKFDAEQSKATANGSIVYDYSTVQTQTVTYSPPVYEEEDLTTYQFNFPPGNLGYLAKCFYDGAIYPNAMFSTAAALTVVSAICGKSWNTNTSLGLNTYNLVVAQSGMGKDEMSKAISRLIEACSQKYPLFKDFFYAGTFASGQGLTKYLKASSTGSFAQILSEFGGLLAKFSNGRDENSQQLMNTMLTLHSASGPNSESSAITYSDPTKNVTSIKSLSYSLLGDTTPHVFESYNSILLNNGFASRFNVFEYHGLRSEMNENPNYEIDPGFIEYMSILAQTSTFLNQRKTIIKATLAPETQIRYKSFKKYCDDNYNRVTLTKGQDVEHHLYSRSLARVIVQATLAAILDTPLTKDGKLYPPCIKEEHWDYFEQLVKTDITNFQNKQAAGALGTGNTVQTKNIERVLDEYLTKPISNTYKIPPELQASGKIKYSYIRQRMTQIACFKTDGNFDDRKLRDTIQTLIKMGRMKEIKDPTAKGLITGDLYWITNT